MDNNSNSRRYRYRTREAAPPRFDYDDRWPEPARSSPSRRRPRGLPLWSKGSIAVGVILALVAAFLARTVIQHGDWSDGMLALAPTAALLAAITLLVGIVRIATGRRTRWTLLQTLLLIIVLAGIAGGSFVIAPELHARQAQYAQRQGQWAEAIAEFALSGEHPPNAPNIAHAYVAWGEQLLAQRQYAGAAENFAVVTTTFAGSGHAVVSQAHHDLYRAYSQWIRADVHKVSYGGAGGALAEFQHYLTDPACDTTCQTEITAMLPLAHYEYGQQLVASHDYAGAITQFETITSKYAKSTYASQAYTAAAQARFERGKQQIAARECSGAVTTYRALVAHYADTPEAAHAKEALAAPQPVSGTMSGLPTNPTPTVALSSQVNTSGFVFSNDYTTKPDASGAFSWSKVAQGDYNLSTKRTVNNGVSYTYYHDAKGNVYTVHVRPLCPVELGTIAYKP